MGFPWRCVAWMALTAAFILPCDAGAQDPDTVRVTVPTSQVQELFGPPDLDQGTADSVDATILTSQVEALFRGTLVVDVATLGPALDPDGYAVVVTDPANDSVLSRVTANGSVSFTDLEPGSYAVSLADVDPACTVSASSPPPVQTVTTARGSFEVTCANREPSDALSLTVGIAPGVDGSVTGKPTVRVADGPTREISADSAAQSRSPIHDRS